MDDEKIIELFFARSEEALDALAQKYGRLLRGVAGNVLVDPRDTEECLNDAYLALWNKIPPEKPDPLSAYVCRVVRNLAVKRYHRNTAEKRNSAYDVALEEIEACFPSPSSVEGEMETMEAARRLNAFLEGLEQRDRILFVRRYYFSDPVKDLARRLGLSPHAVSARLYRLRKALRKFLEKEGGIL